MSQRLSVPKIFFVLQTLRLFAYFIGNVVEGAAAQASHVLTHGFSTDLSTGTVEKLPWLTGMVPRPT
jgi:hypothetical protein